MVRKTRDNLKRIWGHGAHNIEAAAARVTQLQVLFEPIHPEYALLLDYVLMELAVSLGGLEDFAKHAWGAVPDDVQRWRDVPDQEQED